MKTINITKQQKERARVRFEFDRLQNSIMEGGGNLAGALGEVIIYDVFTEKGFEVLDQSTFDYDLIINNYKIDVKAKRFSSHIVPSIDFECNISDFNTDQKCDYYFFVGISEDYKRAYLYGYIKPKEYYQKAKFYKEGERSTISNFLFRCDSHVLQIKELNQFQN